MHVNFGIDVINQIKFENPQLWDDDVQTRAQMILEGAQLEMNTRAIRCRAAWSE